MNFRTLLSFLFISVCFAQASSAQTASNIYKRSDIQPQFKPFYHGVASGDPLSDRVIIWTRITPEDTLPQTVNWKMGLDTNFSTVVNSGSFTTDQNRDYVVKVDVDGLSPDTWYFFEFEHEGRKSLIGRTKTAPTGSRNHLNFAVVSCSDYPSGYFHAYKQISQRNDIEAVIHLGDYLYENGSEGALGRIHEPGHELIGLNDYRMRHSQYKLDPDLRRLHQNYPWMTVWDDHESANDSWNGGAQNHDQSEGLWQDRKSYSIQAYYEWMPIRIPDVNNPERIFRTLKYGDLADIILLDTRLYGRDEQAGSSADADDPSRSLLGPEQLNWLSQQMRTSTAQWKVIAQQVMVAPLEVPIFGPVNLDQWDGYAAERSRVYDTILTHQLKDVVFLTGDIHTAWANDLPLSNYDPATGSGSVAVEFIATSITSFNVGVEIPQGIITAANPHVKYVDLASHGYYILNLESSKTQADWFDIDDITDPQIYSENYAQGWYVNHNESHLNGASGQVSSPLNPAPLPPPLPSNPYVGISDTPEQSLALIGTYPNPFEEGFLLKAFMDSSEDIELVITDIQGRKLFKKSVQNPNNGLIIEEIRPGDLAQGTYYLILKSGEKRIFSKIIRQ